MPDKNLNTFCPKNQQAWRSWLSKNHDSQTSIWLIYYKVTSEKHNLSWSEAVDEALCFGWIDSTKRPIDDEQYMQLFTKRKTKSIWSKINKGKVQKLIDEGMMTSAGLRSVEIAKQNGSWTLLDEAEELSIPKELEKEFKAKPGSKKFFLSLSRSVQKSILQWILMAKKAETRQRRINEVAERAAQKLKPKHIG